MLCYVHKHVPVRKAAAQFDSARNHHGSFSRVSLPGVSPRRPLLLLSFPLPIASTAFDYSVAY